MSQSFEDLIASYMSQSPSAFMAVAIETGEPEVKDYNAPKNAEIEGGDGLCYDCCCDDRGCCKTPAQHLACAAMLVVCVVCCCYVTDGFFGLWTYWPF
ncbi:hypothetical protein TALC_00647 [Thermoplasmatales archaeon BRNA1]|nr:hypothetical protein TALC_00647 [Thermoplasmatales archaeon BRNA1]